MKFVALFLSAMLLSSCATHHTADQPATVAIPPSPTNSTAAMVGTWHCRERKLVWELTADGHWKWWDLEEQSGRPSEPPAIGGAWFIHEGILVLRVETGTSHIPAGIAYTFDIKSVAAQVLMLYEPGTKAQITLRRVA